MAELRGPQDAAPAADAPVWRLLHADCGLDLAKEWPRSRLIRTHTMLLATGGQGSLRVGDRFFRFVRGKGFLLAPGMMAEAQAEANEPLEAARIAFDVWTPERETEDSLLLRKAELPLLGDIALPDRLFGELLRLALRMNECSRGRSGLRRQSLIQELAALLAEQREPAGADDDGAAAIRRTILYMERHYEESISRDTLAGIAGISPWYYSQLFKRATGKSPSDYLNELRIGRAKERLLLSSGNLREVAKRVGYGDEFYFSRKFKRAVGVSPTVYARSRRERIASLSYSYTGHLLALGVVPHATPMDWERDIHRRDYFAAIPVHLRDPRDPSDEAWSHNMEALASAEPGVILSDDEVAEKTRAHIGSVAPTLVIPIAQSHWRSQFRQIAAFLDREREADRWLAAYERKAAQVGDRVRRALGGDTLLVLHLSKRGELWVFGMRYAGSVLYGDLRLRPAPGVEEIAICKRVSVRELAQYGADRILLIAHDRERCRALTADPLWQSLRAVRAGRVHEVNEVLLWVEYSPHAHNLALDRAQQVFG